MNDLSTLLNSRYDEIKELIPLKKIWVVNNSEE